MGIEAGGTSDIAEADKVTDGGDNVVEEEETDSADAKIVTAKLEDTVLGFVILPIGGREYFSLSEMVDKFSLLESSIFSSFSF